jgi:hypothetical protein
VLFVMLMSLAFWDPRKINAHNIFLPVRRRHKIHKRKHETKNARTVLHTNSDGTRTTKRTVQSRQLQNCDTYEK